jgi:hypothetical protein
MSPTKYRAASAAPSQAEARTSRKERHLELVHRSARFIITVMIPVGVAFAAGARPWLVYAVLGAIVAFLGDEGGKPLLRLGYMLIGPSALIAGATIGSIVRSDGIFVAITVLLGLFYGLVEGGDPHLLLVARFTGYGLVLGFAVARLSLPDAIAAGAATLAAWTVSLAWDVARRRLRELAVEPVLTSLLRAIGAWRSRWIFSLAAGLSIGAANLVGLWIGLGHSYWATLTILVVLRADMLESADAITHRVSGTLLGVAAVAVLISCTSNAEVLFAAMVIIAALRWPALSVHLTLGTACITAFVLLVADLLVSSVGDEMHVLQDRLLAIMVGCCFALVGLGLEREITRILRREYPH